MLDLCSLNPETTILGIALKDWFFISILCGPFASLPLLLSALAKVIPINESRLRARGRALMKDPDKFRDPEESASRLWAGSDLRSVFRDTLEVSKSAIFIPDDYFDVPLVVIGLLLSVSLGTLIYFTAEAGHSGVFGYLKTLVAIYYSVIVFCLFVPIGVHLFSISLALAMKALMIAHGLGLYLVGGLMFCGSHRRFWIGLIVLLSFSVALLSHFSLYPPSGCAS